VSSLGGPAVDRAWPPRTPSDSQRLQDRGLALLLARCRCRTRASASAVRPSHARKGRAGGVACGARPAPRLAREAAVPAGWLTRPPETRPSHGTRRSRRRRCSGWVICGYERPAQGVTVSILRRRRCTLRARRALAAPRRRHASGCSHWSVRCGARAALSRSSRKPPVAPSASSSTE
jgi:hypothetical protein